MIRELDREQLRGLFISGAHQLDNHKQAVNDLNVFPVPDGDTGTNMSRTMQSAERALSEKSYKTAGDVAAIVASATLRGARGNSGVILSQIMRGFATGLEGLLVVTPDDFVRAMGVASKTAYRAVMKPTEGTILTVIRRMAEAAESLDDDGDIYTLLEAVVAYGNEALAETQNMLPVLKKAGVVDAGGKGLMLIFEGMLAFLSDGMVEKQEEDSAADTLAVKEVKGTLKYSYCTEFIIKKSVAAKNGEALKKDILSQGDSVLVIDDADIIKVHIHTNHPGFILERGLAFGMLSDIKIDNLAEQQEEQAAKAEAAPREHKPVAIVTVAAGDGVSALFSDLGADVVVSGGQSMNPSAEDLLEAVESLSADVIYILPNNSNIVLTAEQAADMSKQNVRVIKTKTIPQGIAAIMAFEEDDQDAEITMGEAAAGVSTGLITNAVRDTEMDGLTIQKDDYLALAEGEIIAADRAEEAAIGALFDKLMHEEVFAVTLIYGEGVEAETAEKYADTLSAEWPDAEVALVFGGQPVYRFILSVE